MTPAELSAYKHIHEIHLEGNTPFVKTFNNCSDLYLRSIDQSLSEEERKQAFDDWFNLRQQLELGIL